MVRFNGEIYLVQLGRYGNGRLAIRLTELNGEPAYTATVNLPEEPLPEGYLFIKDWGTNEGIFAALVAAGLITDTGKRVPSGFCEAKVALLYEPGRLE